MFAIASISLFGWALILPHPILIAGAIFEETVFHIVAAIFFALAAGLIVIIDAIEKKFDIVIQDRISRISLPWALAQILFGLICLAVYIRFFC